MSLNREVEAKIQEALEEIAERIVRKAKQKCPVDTGALRDSITVEVRDNKIIIGTPKEYAAEVEYGTAEMRPQPYLRPAIDEIVVERIRVK